MADAMTQVRENLGDDAIIVATREDKSGMGVRVTAAVDETEPDAPYVNGDGAEPFAIRDADDVEPDDAGDLHERLIDILMHHGTPGWAIDRLVTDVTEDGIATPNQALTATFDRTLAFKGFARGGWKRPALLAGPPGAGKTTACAKLAARAVLKGHVPAVLTTDVDRAGGTEQLAALTKVMNIRLVTVEDADALPDAIETVTGVDQIIIDSAGRNPLAKEDMRALGKLCDSADIEPVLVLPAGGDADEAAEIARIFAAMGCKRLMPTRMDTTRRLGSLLTAAMGSGLPLADFSDTAAIAEGLKAPSPTLLANRFIELETISSHSSVTVSDTKT